MLCFFFFGKVFLIRSVFFLFSNFSVVSVHLHQSHNVKKWLVIARPTSLRAVVFL